MYVGRRSRVHIAGTRTLHSPSGARKIKMVPGRLPATDHILRPGSSLPTVAGATLLAGMLAVGHHTHHYPGRRLWSW